MRKISLVLLTLIIAVSACKKETNAVECPYKDSAASAPQNERDSIQRYLTANGITNATQHPSGFYYILDSAGTGTEPTVCSYITVQYKGRYFSGAHLDSTAGTSVAKFTLGGTIEGWRKGLPLVKAGGGITLYIPPTLGYGLTDYRDQLSNNIIVPANSYLKFKIAVFGVQ